MVLSFVHILSPSAEAEVNSLNSILNWNQDLTPLPMLDLVFLDPEMVQTPITKKSLKSSLEQWQSFEDPKSKEYSQKSKVQLWQTINFLKHLNHLLVMNYYHKNVREIEGHNTEELGAQIRRKLSLVIGNLLAQKLEPEEKSLLTFQKFLIDFQNPNLRHHAVKSINSVVTYNLSDQRKRLISFGSHLLNLYSNKPNSQEAIHGLNHLSPYMTKDAYTLTQLYLARLKLGYHFDGRKSGEFHPTYSRHLKMISNLCSSFSDTQNSHILSSMLSIWTKSKNFNGQWDKPPFNTECYKNLVPYLATRERVAIKYWKNKAFQLAYNIYDQIAEKTTKDSKQVLIQKRIVGLAKIIYEQNKDISFYQGVYAKALKLVTQTQFRMQLRSELFNVTKTYLESAYRKYSAIPDLDSIVKTFLDHSGNENNSRVISVLEAKILHRDKNYEKAWKAYYKLSRSTPKVEQRIRDLENSITNYALHSKWSLEEPWLNLKYGPKKEHKKFEQLHNELLAIDSYKRPNSWPAAINLGMVHLINKNPKKSYNIWKPYWEKNPKVANINAVQGALIVKLFDLQSWNLIAEVLAFVKEHKLKPIYDGKLIEINKYQEKATYEIGKSALTNMELLKAEQAFENLIFNFKNSINYPEYLAQIIKTSRLLHKHKLLKKYLEKFIKIGQKHPSYEANLLSIINLLKGMGKIEQTLKYVRKFVEDFPDPNKSLKQLHLLVRLCKILPKDGYCKTNLGQTAFADVVRKHESTKKFKENIITQLNKVKVASKNQNSKKLREIEQELTNLGKSNPMVKDTINFVWFSQIKIISDSLIKKLRSRTISNEEAVKHYENIRQTFTGICNRRRVSSCAQSFKELLSLTIEMKSFLALSNSQQLLNTYSELEANLRSRMARYLSRNITEPQVAQKILWDTMKEWNFNNDPYTGIGYIQAIEYAKKPQLKG